MSSLGVQSLWWFCHVAAHNIGVPKECLGREKINNEQDTHVLNIVFIHYIHMHIINESILVFNSTVCF